MARREHPVFPGLQRQLTALGERIRVARLRRRISGVVFAERVGVSRDTMNRLEKGDSTISIGTYATALRVLGLDKDLDRVAADDELGRKLQDAELLNRGARRAT